LGFPGSEWDGSIAQAPAQAAWEEMGFVRHTFTHFHLDLTVLTAQLPQTTVPQRGEFHGPNAFRPDDLTTLMRKAHDLAWPEFKKP
jgi:A/G-specific adenine glycosylase